MSPTDIMAQNYAFKYFIVALPQNQPYVAHVEINRADKMNAFFEAYAITPNPAPFLLPDSTN